MTLADKLEGDYIGRVINKFAILTIGIIFTATGASLGLKAAVGVNAWDAVSQSISTVLDMKVGTFSMILNISCVLIQVLLLKKEFKINRVLQIFVAVLLGIVINFMFYNVLSLFTIGSYVVNMLLFILSIVICALGVSIVTAIDFISFPLEACCMVISKKFNKNFGAVRQSVDIISVIIALGVALIFKDSVTVREGTVIGMITFGPMIDRFMKLMIPKFKKLKLVSAEA